MSEKSGPKAKNIARVPGVSIPLSIVNVEHTHPQNKSIYANKGFVPDKVSENQQDWENQY